jgi:hypothetical protein
MLGSPITKYQAADIRARDAALRNWLKENKTNSYKREELPAELDPPTNDERSQCEIFEFLHDPPAQYFCYIVRRGDYWIASNWLGAPLNEGRVVFIGAEYKSNMGDKRQPIWFRGINGVCYSGIFYKSTGDYARVKRVKSLARIRR